MNSALLEARLSAASSATIKYTPDGGTITLHAKVEGERLRISVADTGVGIAPEDQEAIFERFYTAGDTQLHSTSKTAFRGGGLGLGLRSRAGSSRRMAAANGSKALVTIRSICRAARFAWSFPCRRARQGEAYRAMW